ncbi:DUF4097 family beta strand repeat-containing protein [Jiangella mangrovi]|uniref:DUF4097 domain-containing protein n=1 Tax=Jiangella mangrovi TaxID=1524084 RepID=A0A7W9LNP0_9ACTN|nr:DUF4097 family beta strand repeat-containing protein [Jiangella mangrovi]MBB5790510.1 hypothetical protein [Jiangella mangrovi]
MANETRPVAPSAPPAGRRLPVRRGLSFAAIGAMAFAGLTALSWITHSRESVTIDDPVDRVEIDVSSGRVEIVGSPSDETRLDFSVKSGWSRDGGIDHAIVGRTLQVTGGCDSGMILGIWCESDVTITVPASAVVTADASAGTLVVSGLAGSTVLESDAGSITVTDQRGSLTAHSDAGSVTVSGLDAEVAKVTSSAGEVSVSAVSAPMSLDAESSAGSVWVSVPDDVAYDVETDSAVGRETVSVDSVNGARHEIRAFSSAGSVSVVSAR